MRAIVVASIFALPPVLHAAESAPDFTTEVRPILSRYCFKCHGPDDKTRKGELRLDLRAEALKPAESGGPAIIPGDVAKSELVKRIFTDDTEEIMPPRSTKQEMSAAQKDLLKRWIAAGAEYKQHWSFVAPQRPPLQSSGKFPSKSPIDGFLAARLEKEGLSISPEADPATICRRLYLDLVGMAPTPEELAAFQKDAATGIDGAVERLADKLIASPHYGERWGRRWLDLARYADTNGYEKDRERSIWPYRDWVINAINAGMPYDQFTIEQIAGDMLPDPTQAQRVATGFHRNTMLNEEGGIDPLEFRFHAMTDRVATTGAVWLGLTLGCAQCHTHKYDPILHTEYYGVMAFLDNADEPEFDLGAPDAPQKIKANAEKAEKLFTTLMEDTPAVGGKSPRETVEGIFADWLKTERARNLTWTVLKPTDAKSNLPLLTVQPDHSVFCSGDISKSDTYELVFAGVPAGTTALRLEALPDDRLPAHGPGLCYYEGPRGDFFMGEFQAEAGGQPLKFSGASESYAKNNFGSQASAKLATDGDPQTGWSCAGRMGEPHEAVFVLEKPLAAASTVRIKMMFGRHYACSLGRFRISATGSANPIARSLPENLALLLSVPDTQLSATQREALRRHFLLTSFKAKSAEAEIKEIRRLLAPPRGTSTLVMRERPPENPRKTFLRNRGEYMQPKEQISAMVPAFLNPLPKDAPRNRLTFARWLVSRDNPLTARVAVNRQWAAYFGRGFVKTTEDFGFQSEAPSHPELLDWLAVEFMDTGWSLKKLDRLIVTSRAYRQSSRVLPEHLARDPENRLLAHFPRTRLDAEVIRDSALRASGLLSPTIGGPSVRPAQADGVTEVAYGSPKWNADGAPNRFRRSLYTFAKRTAPFALYNTFDAPTGEACIARRDVSNTPLQALSVLNDVVFMEAARALGKLLAADPGDTAARIDHAYVRVLARQPTTEERAMLTQFFEAQRTRFTSGELNAGQFLGDPKDANSEVAAWATVARTLLNLDETVSKR
jgi:hypothetical protein